MTNDNLKTLARARTQKERCANPWNGECGNTDIELYIVYKGNSLPICRSCWDDIADKEVEWGENYAFS